MSAEETTNLVAEQTEGLAAVEQCSLQEEPKVVDIEQVPDEPIDDDDGWDNEDGWDDDE